jgi:predicted ATPase
MITGSIKNEGLKYKSLPTPETSPGLFKLHTLAAFIGPRGSGKTNAVVLLARRLLDDKSINRIFIISPTFDSNRIFDLLDPKPEDVFKNLQTALQDLQNINTANTKSLRHCLRNGNGFCVGTVRLCR